MNQGRSIRPNSIIDQYKVLVDSSIKVTEWRGHSNKFFMTLNLAVFSLPALSSTRDNTSIITNVIGIFLCLIWIRANRSYKILNTAKFKLIHELESKLDEQIFEQEWDLLRAGGYESLSSIEAMNPILFAALHLILIVTAYL